MAFGVWNNLDELALFLAIERLDWETNEEFYARIKKFAKYKYGVDYNTQVHSIPLQVGLDSYRIGEISCLKEYSCKIDWEYIILENEDEYVRVFINTPDCTIEKISQTINSSNTFRFIYFKDSYKNISTKKLIRSENQTLINKRVSGKSIHLEKNIVESSFMIEDNLYISNRVSDLQKIKIRGDYFIDFRNGYIEAYDNEYPEVKISYKTSDQEFVFEITDINLVPMNLITQYGITNELIEMLPYILNGQIWGK